MMVGGVFASVGMILASFAKSITHIYLCTGVITGRVTKSVKYLDFVNKFMLRVASTSLSVCLSVLIE